jgi:hypothetical protein
MKIGVVAFSTLPLVAPSQKTPILPLLATNKMKNPFSTWNWKVKKP